MSKIGPQFGPQHGGNELNFSTLEPSWLHLGAILPPKWPQDPPRGHLGAILGSSWSHFGILGLKLWIDWPQRGGGWWAQPVDIIILLHYYIFILLYYCISILLYYRIIRSLDYYITMLLYDYIILLYYCIMI